MAQTPANFLLQIFLHCTTLPQKPEPRQEPVASHPKAAGKNYYRFHRRRSFIAWSRSTAASALVIGASGLKVLSG